LFSGGFDSPVAAWFVARRGAEVHFLHFVLGSSRSAEEAFKVASKLAREWLHGYSPRFIVVDFRRVTEAIANNVRRDYRQVVLRALMYEAASLLAQRMGFDALITGEAIGQASSQTLRNLAAIEATLTARGFRTLILRPLLGMDKEEIMAWARRIGTYELSEKVAEYCAIAPSLVTTRAKVGELLNELSKVDESLIRATVREAKVLNLLKDTPLDAVLDTGVEIDYIPEGAVVIDMRSRKEYEEWHYPGAIHISEAGDLRRFKGKTVVLYCAHGNASYLVAEMLRREGVKAFSLKGGIKAVKKACGLKP
jgi:thiamine biosynthesis protein ThiI